MNNMTEKLVKDGREGRRTQMHLTITILVVFSCFSASSALSSRPIPSNMSMPRAFCMKIFISFQSATCWSLQEPLPRSYQD